MESHDTPASDERSSEVPTRKAYEKPKLEVYGDLTEITKSLMGAMGADGAGHPNKHFTS